MLRTFVDAVVTLFKANPLAFLVAGGGLWALGWARRQARRPKGNLLLGILEVLALAGWIHKNRHNVTRAVAWTVLAATVAGWALAIWLRPGLGLRLILPATVTALALGAFWVDDRLGDKPLRRVIADWVDGKNVRTAAALTPDVHVGRARALPGGGWEAPLHVADGTDLDALAVGARAVARGIPVRSVEVVPGDQVGEATIRLSPDAPPPDIDPWVALAEPVRWPGAHSTDPDALVPVGVDKWHRRLFIARPGLGGRHLLIAGATGAGKSALLAAILAELAHRDHTALVLLDPDRVEFDLWTPRATVVHSGVADCRQALIALAHSDNRGNFLDQRAARVAQLGRRTAPVDDRWPRVIVVIDEVAAITDTRGEGAKAMDSISQIAARGRKLGIGLILATQRPDVGSIEGPARANMRARIALGHGDAQGNRMTLGDGAPAAHEIPESLPGAFYLKRDRQFDAGRGELLHPRRPVPDGEDPIEEAAAEIAEATRHLRVEEADL